MVDHQPNLEGPVALVFTTKYLACEMAPPNLSIITQICPNPTTFRPFHRLTLVDPDVANEIELAWVRQTRTEIMHVARIEGIDSVEYGEAVLGDLTAH